METEVSEACSRGVGKNETKCILQVGTFFRDDPSVLNDSVVAPLQTETFLQAAKSENELP